MFPGKTQITGFRLLVPQIERGIRFRVASRRTKRQKMIDKQNGRVAGNDAVSADGISEATRKEALLKTGALQNAILTSANFSIIATDEKGIIQLFNVGAERMLGYRAAEVVNKISPSDMHDSLEVTARARSEERRV